MIKIIVKIKFAGNVLREHQCFSTFLTSFRLAENLVVVAIYQIIPQICRQRKEKILF